MIVHILLSALALQTAQAPAAPDPVAEFRDLCIDTKAALPAVARSAQRSGWTVGGANALLRTWSKTVGAERRMLIAGLTDDSRLTCSVQVRPGIANVARALPAALGPKAAAVDAWKGLYLIAESAQALRSRDAAFVSVTSTADATMLVYLRPKR